MKSKELENLIRVKRALADKYDRLARVIKSKPHSAKLYRRAESYRNQADRLSTAGR